MPTLLAATWDMALDISMQHGRTTRRQGEVAASQAGLDDPAALRAFTTADTMTGIVPPHSCGGRSPFWFPMVLHFLPRCDLSAALKSHVRPPRRARAILPGVGDNTDLGRPRAGRRRAGRMWAVVVNSESWASLAVANEYVALRRVPEWNVVYLRRPCRANLSIGVDEFRERILKPILKTIAARGLGGQIDCIAYSADIPYAVGVSADVGQQKLPKEITTEASINGLTYLAGLVLAKNVNYLSLESNLYCRRRLGMGRVRLDGPGEIEKLGNARNLMRTKKWAEAEPILRELAAAHPAAEFVQLHLASWPVSHRQGRRRAGGAGEGGRGRLSRRRPPAQRRRFCSLAQAARLPAAAGNGGGRRLQAPAAAGLPQAPPPGTPAASRQQPGPAPPLYPLDDAGHDQRPGQFTCRGARLPASQRSRRRLAAQGNDLLHAERRHPLDDTAMGLPRGGPTTPPVGRGG